MTIFNIRRRQSNDDLSPQEVEERLAAEAERLNDEAHDRVPEDVYQEQP